MAIMNGTKLAVYNTGTKFAHATDCSIEISMDTIDTTTKDSAGWRDLLPGLRQASINTSNLYEDSSTEGVDELWTAFLARTPLTLRFSTEVVGEERFTGSFYLTSLSLTGGVEDAASYSATFELSGALIKETVS